MQDLKHASPHAVYVEHLRKGELAFQVASDGSPVFFPRVSAPETGDTALEWRVSRGIGTVYATTAIHSRNEPPRNVALVDLDEGYRMMSRVEGIPAPEVRIGLRVKVDILPGERDEPPLPVFRPLDAAEVQP